MPTSNCDPKNCAMCAHCTEDRMHKYDPPNNTPYDQLDSWLATLVLPALLAACLCAIAGLAAGYFVVGV